MFDMKFQTLFQVVKVINSSDGGAVLDSKKEKNSEYPSVAQSYSFEQCRTTPSIQNNSGSGKISVNISRDQVQSLLVLKFDSSTFTKM
jgi:hypothetical protein